MNHKQQLDIVSEQIRQMSAQDRSQALCGMLGWFSALAKRADTGDAQEWEIQALGEFIRATQVSIRLLQAPWVEHASSRSQS